MNENQQHSRRRGGRLALALVALLIFGTGVMAGHSGLPVVGAADSLQNQEAFKAFEQAWNLIHENYVDPESIDDTKLIQGATAGMVDALGDTGHSTYLSPLDVETSDPNLTGEYVGIGLSFDFSGIQPRVLYTLPESPAEKAGVLPGDVLTSVDGKRVDGLSATQLSQMLRGKEGTSVSLSFLRDGGATFDVDLVRSKITVNPVSWWMLPGHIAQIRIEEFSQGTGEKTAQAVADAEAAGATAFVLDLRSNPGGLLDELEKVSQVFLPTGSVIFQQEDRSGTIIDHAIGQGTDFAYPLAVLIDRGSASAAEILAAALSENGAGTTIGQTTFGTGTVLNGFPLSDGGLLVLGVQLWLTPHGEQVWKVGVAPDIPVALDNLSDRVRPQTGKTMTSAQLKSSGDTQLQAAIDWINDHGAGRG